MAEKKKDKKDSWESVVWKPHKYNERLELKSGTYLRSFCPHCDSELTRDQMLRLEVINAKGESGLLKISAYLNHFDRKTDIKLPRGREVKDLRCPDCHQSLTVKGKRCPVDHARVASFLIGISHTRVPFFICMKEGCRWHDISPDDEIQIILDESHEW